MNKTTDNTKKWQEDAALERFRLIAPLLDEVSSNSLLKRVTKHYIVMIERKVVD